MKYSRHSRHHTSRHRHRESKRRDVLKKQIFAGLAVVLIFLGVAGIWIYQTQKIQKSRDVRAGSGMAEDAGSSYRNITYKGKEYQYNSLITTVLYAGVDSEGKMQEYARYAAAPNADSMALLVLDKKHGKISVIQLSRDTMTEVRRYTMNGTDRGTYLTHLGYAYTYGDGGEVSCENLREAVSGLFRGIPVNEYVVTNLSSIQYLNSLAGGVTVTVPNDSLSAKYPEMAEGTEVILDETNLETFLRYRDTSEHYSNQPRLERQKTYLTAYIQKVQTILPEDPEGMWNKLEDIEDYVQTSVTKNKYLKFVNLLEQTELTEESFYELKGEHRTGAKHDEFYADEEALMELIIELFYLEV